METEQILPKKKEIAGGGPEKNAFSTCFLTWKKLEAGHRGTKSGRGIEEPEGGPRDESMREIML